jgi:ketosteroid isomerase-like protein
MAEDAVVAEIRRLEERRCQALMARDYRAISDLVADDLIHIHTTGLVEDKAAYMAGIEQRLDFSDVVREDLTVRVYGDVAVATGRLSQTVRVRTTDRRIDMKIVTTQVWVRWGGTWRQSSFQATHLA